MSVKQIDSELFDVLSAYQAQSTPDHVNGVAVLSALSRDDFSLYVCINFDSPGICRSRPLFKAAVEAAANAIWAETYHALYGEEAAPYVNEQMLTESFEASYADTRNS